MRETIRKHTSSGKGGGLLIGAQSPACDPYKLTFIILARELWERTGGHEATDDDAIRWPLPDWIVFLPRLT